MIGMSGFELRFDLAGRAAVRVSGGPVARRHVEPVPPEAPWVAEARCGEATGWLLAKVAPSDPERGAGTARPRGGARGRAARRGTAARAVGADGRPARAADAPAADRRDDAAGRGRGSDRGSLRARGPRAAPRRAATHGPRSARAADRGARGDARARPGGAPGARARRRDAARGTRVRGARGHHPRAARRAAAHVRARSRTGRRARGRWPATHDWKCSTSDQIRPAGASPPAPPGRRWNGPNERSAGSRTWAIFSPWQADPRSRCTRSGVKLVLPAAPPSG